MFKHVDAAAVLWVTCQVYAERVNAASEGCVRCECSRMSPDFAGGFGLIQECVEGPI